MLAVVLLALLGDPRLVLAPPSGPTLAELLTGKLPFAPVEAVALVLDLAHVLQAAHRLGLGVQVWTVNKENDARRLLDWGVDALITDRPDVIVPVVRGADLVGSAGSDPEYAGRRSRT